MEQKKNEPKTEKAPVKNPYLEGTENESVGKGNAKNAANKKGNRPLTSKSNQKSGSNENTQPNSSRRPLTGAQNNLERKTIDNGGLRAATAGGSMQRNQTFHHLFGRTSYGNYDVNEDYNGPVGVGQYAMQDYVGHTTVDSQKMNPPNYTLQTKKKYNRQILGKNLIQDMVGLDAPGVGIYSPDNRPVSRDSPKHIIPKARRFGEFSSINKFQLSLPHSYNRLNTRMHYASTGGAIGRELRFTREIIDKNNIKEQGVRTRNPGPGAYQNDIYYSIEGRQLCKTLRNFGVAHSQMINDKITSKSPGPNAYVPQGKWKWRNEPQQTRSFSKEERIKMSRLTTPGPSDYRTHNPDTTKRLAGRPNFGTQKRKFNFNKIFTLNHIYKGIFSKQV